MITIGAFARMTGLTPKALRLYHERGLVPPGSVDPGTGYRGYRISQVGEAIRVAVLRQAGMSLDQIAEVLAHPDRADGLVADHREALARTRLAEDAALEALVSGTPLPRERTLPATPHLSVTVDADPQVDAVPQPRTDAVLETVRASMAEAGVAAAGLPWLTMHPRGEDVVEFVLRVPVEETGRAVAGTRAETMPARTESFVVASGDGEKTHLMALAALCAVPGADPRTLRWTDLGPVGVDIALAVSGER